MLRLFVEGMVMVLAVGSLSLWRIGQSVPPRDVFVVAKVTGSPRACLGFIQFCLES